MNLCKLVLRRPRYLHFSHLALNSHSRQRQLILCPAVKSHLSSAPFDLIDNNDTILNLAKSYLCASYQPTPNIALSENMKPIDWSNRAAQMQNEGTAHENKKSYLQFMPL